MGTALCRLAHLFVAFCCFLMLLVLLAALPRQSPSRMEKSYNRQHQPTRTNKNSQITVLPAKSNINANQHTRGDRHTGILPAPQRHTHTHKHTRRPTHTSCTHARLLSMYALTRFMVSTFALVGCLVSFNRFMFMFR